MVGVENTFLREQNQHFFDEPGLGCASAFIGEGQDPYPWA